MATPGGLAGQQTPAEVGVPGWPPRGIPSRTVGQRQPPAKRRPWSGRLSTGCGSSPWHWGLDPVGCLCSTVGPCLDPGREGMGDASGERCSRLDLLSCSPDPGDAARGFNTRGTGMAYGSSLLRDGVHAAPSRSRLYSITPPLQPPASLFGPGSLGGRGWGWLPVLPSRSRYAEWRVVALWRGSCSRTTAEQNRRSANPPLRMAAPAQAISADWAQCMARSKAWAR